MWIVRYETDGFVEKEIFENKKQAKKYYDTVLMNLGRYLLDLRIYKKGV